MPEARAIGASRPAIGAARVGRRSLTIGTQVRQARAHRSAEPFPIGQSGQVDDEERLALLKRHWEFAATDQDITHEMYHDDAVLEFPQSGERFEGVENFR